MKAILFIVAGPLLFIVAATRGSQRISVLPSRTAAHVVANPADTTTLNGQWFLQPLLPADTAAGKIPMLQINLAGKTFSGNTGCNRMRGNFQQTDTSLVFSQNMVTTKMNCTGYDEAAFIRNLQRTNRFKIDNGTLVLMFDATELSRWTRKPDRQVKIKRA